MTAPAGRAPGRDERALPAAPQGGAPRRIARILAFVVVALGVVVLGIGWGLGVPLARTVLPGLMHMTPLTALELVLCGAALALLATDAPRPWSRTAAFVLALPALTIAGLVLVKYLVHWDTAVDRLLFRRSVEATGVALPGLPAPNTAFALVAIAAGLLLLAAKERAGRAPVALALVGGLVALQALIGYAFGVEPLYRVSAFSAIALHTTVGLLLLSTGMLYAQPDRGPIRLLYDDGPAGAIARRLFPVALLAPLVIGFLELEGERRRLYGSEVGTSLMVIGALVVTAAAVWLGAAALIRSQAGLRESEGRYRRISESGIVGLFCWDLNGPIAEANDAFLSLLGYTRADLAEGRVDWRSMTPPEYHESDAVKVRELLETGRHGPYEKAYLHRDGHPVPVLVASAFFEGSAERGVAVCIDISARVEAEAEQERLLALERTLRDQAEEASRAKSQFMSTMSHELRTPLNAIIGYADLLDLNSGTADADGERRYLERIRLAAAHQKQLIDDVLTFSRLQAGREETREEEVSVRQLLQEIDAVVAPLAERKGLALVLDDDAAPPSVPTDARKLRQILVNLLGNAVKFTSAGHVRLTIDTAPGSVRFAVEDTGIGIDPADRERIFDSFWQGDRSLTRGSEGSGLGLAISRRLATLLGGEILVDSEPGVGSRFTLVLPDSGIPAGAAHEEPAADGARP